MPNPLQAQVSAVLKAAEEQAGEKSGDDDLTPEQWKKRYQDAQREMNRAQAAEKAAKEEAERLRSLESANTGRVNSLEAQIQALSQALSSPHGPNAQQPDDSDPWANVADEYGAVDPKALAMAMAKERERTKTELLQAMQGMMGPVFQSLGTNARERLLSTIPNSPHKAEFQRRLDERIREVASQQGVDPAVINNPKSIEFIADGLIGAMQREGKLVMGVSESPAGGSQFGEASFGPDFSTVGAATGQEEDDYEVRLPLESRTDMRHYDALAGALEEHGISVDDLLKRQAQEAKMRSTA